MNIRFIFKDEEVEYCIKPETFVQIKLAEGPRGLRGQDGQQGPQGEPGHTPVKGVDYFTEEDKQEMLSGVETEIDELDRTKADITDIPDVSNFITKEVNNLTNYTLKTATGSLIDLEINQSTYVITLKLKDIDGNVISTDTIDLPLESVVIGGRFDSANKKIVLTLENGNTVDIPVGDLVTGLQTEITLQNKLASDLVDDTNSGNKFVTTSEKTAWNAKLDQSDLADYVTRTTYASSSRGGVFMWANLYATAMNGGYLKSQVKTYENYGTGNNEMFISKGTLENVITGKHLINQTTLDDSQAEQDAEVQALQDKVDLLESLIPTDTATGESLTLSNTARYPFKEFNVGGNTKQQSYTGANLLKFTSRSFTSYGLTYSCDDKGVVTLTGTATAGNSIAYNQSANASILNAGTYKIKVIGTGLENIATLQRTDTSGYITLNSSKEASITIENDNTSFRMLIVTASGITYNSSFYITLAQGDTATDEPYVGGIASPNPSYPQEIENVSGEVEVKVENKNLNDGSIVRKGYYNANGTFVSNNTFRANVMKVSPNTRYALSTTLSQGLYNTMVLLDKNRNLISTISYLNKNGAIVEKGYNNEYFKYAIFTTPANCCYVSAGLLASTDEEYNNKVMLEPVETSATTPTSYEPHEEQTATLHLPEGMEMCKIGDYQDSFVYQGDKWYKNKKVRKYVFDGTESWLFNGEATTPTNRTTFSLSGLSFISTDYLSDCFIKDSTSSYRMVLNTSGTIYISTDNTATGITSGDSNATKVTKFKTWLNSNNVTLYTPANTSQEEITDTTLISDLENLKNLYSYKGTTYIFSSNEPSPVFEVVYRKSLG